MMHSCPFCRIMLPNLEDMWNPIGRGFDGSPASVGGIRSCAWCASSAQIMDTTRTMLQQVAQPLTGFFAALSSLLALCQEFVCEDDVAFTQRGSFLTEDSQVSFAQQDQFLVIQEYERGWQVTTSYSSQDREDWLAQWRT